MLAATERRKLQLHQRSWQVMRGTHLNSLLLAVPGWGGGGWGGLVRLTAVRATPGSWKTPKRHRKEPQDGVKCI